jgi:hypothetical protein
MTCRFKVLGSAPDRNSKAPELSARDKLSSSFIKALEKDWKEHGVAIIEQIRRENPVKYGELIARLVPMEINPPASPFAEAKSTRDVCRLLLQQADVPEWLIDDAMIERVHAAHQHLCDEVESIKAQVEN